MTIERINPQGRKYYLSGEPNINSTIISFGAKKIVVKQSIDKLSEQWFNWQMKGEYIQNAFSQLTPDEREFLMTGITSEEWNEIFEENND